MFHLKVLIDVLANRSKKTDQIFQSHGSSFTPAEVINHLKNVLKNAKIISRRILWMTRQRALYKVAQNHFSIIYETEDHTNKRHTNKQFKQLSDDQAYPHFIITWSSVPTFQAYPPFFSSDDEAYPHFIIRWSSVPTFYYQMIKRTHILFLRWSSVPTFFS
jgi:hypothetical protein